MKKTLLIAAAALATGIISTTAQAQNVYSQNIVGYVNQSVGPSKFLLANNPFDLSSLPGGNNITNVLTGNLPDSTFVYVYQGGSYVTEQYIAGYGWYPAAAILAPGVGFFIQTPAGSSITNTYTGNVLVGTATNALVNGFTLTGAAVPQALPPGCAGITDSTNTLVFPAQDSDFIYRWDYASQGYITAQYIGGYGWYDGVSDTNGPVLNVGEGIFAQTTAAKNWVRTFSVQ